MPDASHRIAVIGAGPAGLMAAEVLARAGARVSVYERMPSAGRKLLMAGRGGLNITHSEDLSRFLERYGGATSRLRDVIEAFPPAAVRAWCQGLGQDTFVGSSGRVFPKAFKASPLLRAWLRRLGELGVELHLRHRWVGWSEAGGAMLESPAGSIEVRADAFVLALGGASWPRLGSDGWWAEILAADSVAVAPLQAANCGFVVRWSEVFRDRFQGQPLKRIELRFRERSVRGEAIITRTGIEGGAVYALSSSLREAVLDQGSADLRVALRPDLSQEELRRRLDTPRGKQSLSTFLRKAVNLSPVEIGLLHEAAASRSGALGKMSADSMAELINDVPVMLAGVAPLERAISTAGGVRFSELDGDFMLRRRPGVFVAGEMLDWEAPTGGYLLQASLATGAAAGRGALAWLSRR